MSFLIGFIVTILAAIVIVRMYFKSTWMKAVEDVDMTGKTIIITGANTGVGKALALELAKKNARVILACRSIVRGEGARMEIRAASGREDGGLILKQLDLSSLTSVRNFAKDIITTEKRLDVLVNNAGITGQPITTTIDGLELTYQTNHFGPFLLSHLLLDLLKNSGPGSRIVNVGSHAHTMATLDLDYMMPSQLLSLKRGYFEKKPQLFLYQNSKLMNVMFTFELSRRLKDSGVTVNCVHPGVVRTNMIKERRLPVMVFRLFLEVIAKSPCEGCQPILKCVASRQLDKVTGKYFGNGEEDHALHKMTLNRDACARLWEISKKLTKL